MYTSMFRKAMLGDTATLNLDFTTGVLDSRLTFTRSGTGTYINSSGYVTTAAANAPRFDYSPTNIGEPRGLLIEGQATNMCRWSTDTGSWDSATSGVTKTTETIVAPSGVSTSVDRWVASASSYKTFNSTGGLATTNYTLSMWVRTVSGTATFGLRVNNLADGSNQVFNNATITTTWQRLQVTFNNTAAGTLQGGMAQWSVIGGPGTAIDVYVWGAQLEAGSGASSYIPTGASQVTRNGDSCVMTGTNFSSWFNSAQGTFLAEFQTLYSGLTNDSNLLLALDSNANKRIMYFNTGADTMGSFDGTTIIGAAGDVTGNISKVASTYTSTSRSLVSNGGTVATGAVAAGYSSASSLGITSNNPKVLLRKLKFYPTALSDAAIQTLTTP